MKLDVAISIIVEKPREQNVETECFMVKKENSCKFICDNKK